VPRRFDRFIDDLSCVELSPRACNQFAHISGDARGNAIRRRNLRLYLEELDAIGPRLLLVGEAVSYRGGRLTGIPFVSETVMLCGVDLANGSRVLGAERDYRKADLSTRVSTEASATMVWGTIRDIEPIPLLWNAFSLSSVRRRKSVDEPDAGAGGARDRRAIRHPPDSPLRHRTRRRDR
jgi:hypothetical protein